MFDATRHCVAFSFERDREKTSSEKRIFFHREKWVVSTKCSKKKLWGKSESQRRHRIHCFGENEGARRRGEDIEVYQTSSRGEPCFKRKLCGPDQKMKERSFKIRSIKRLLPEGFNGESKFVFCKRRQKGRTAPFNNIKDNSFLPPRNVTF